MSEDILARLKHAAENDPDKMIFVYPGDVISAIEELKTTRPLDTNGRCAYYQGVGDDDCVECKHAPCNQPLCAAIARVWDTPEEDEAWKHLAR